MNLYLEDFVEGIKSAMSMSKTGSNIFEMKGGNMFPTNASQKMWQFAKHPGQVHFSDGTNSYSFKGDLKDEDTELEKLPDVPWPELFDKAESKGKAQVHRSDPGSMYFTLQEGTQNPTYTFRHLSENKWKAIPKKKTVKKQMDAPPAIPNVNLESIKQGMLQELQIKLAEGEAGGSPGFFNDTLGKLPGAIINGATSLGMAPATLGGPTGGSFAHGLGAVGLGALPGLGLGLGYDQFKRHLVNTPEENQQETTEDRLKRIAIPAAATGGMALAGRQLFPNAVDSNLAGNPVKPV